jgi:hypothetical protein
VLGDVALELRGVEADDTEHQRHRLHQPVARAADLVRSSRRRGDVAVPRAVDGHASGHDDRPGLGLEHHLARLARCADTTGEGVQQVADTRAVEQVEGDLLEDLGVERDGVTGLARRQHRAVGLHEPVDDLHVLAGDDRLPLAVVGGEQPDVAQPWRLRTAGVEGHPRHHEGRRRVAAEEPVPLDEDHAGPGIGCRERGAETGRPSADDQDVGLSRLQR